MRGLPWAWEFAVRGKRVARLVRRAGLVGVHRRRSRGITRRSPAREPAPDPVKRHFAARGPNRPWVVDMTEHAVDEGKLYLAAAIDVSSPMVVGWSMDDRPVAGLAVDGVNMAAWNRRPDPGLVHQLGRGAPILP